MALTGHRRALVVLLAAASVVGVAGSAAARLPGRGDSAANGGAVTPAAATPVTIVGRKVLKQTATIGGAKGVVTIGALSLRSTCTDLGAGWFKVGVEAKSTAAGLLVSTAGSGTDLSGTYQAIATFDNAAVAGHLEPFEILHSNGTTKRFELTLSVHTLGADCATLLVAYSG